MKIRCVGITGRIGANNVSVGAIATSSTSPLLLLMVLTPPLVNLLILMLEDHPTSTRTLEPTRPEDLNDTRMLRRPQILSWHAHVTMLEVSSWMHLLMPISNRRGTMSRKSSGPHMRCSMLIAGGFGDSWFEGKVRGGDNGDRCRTCCSCLYYDKDGDEGSPERRFL